MENHEYKGIRNEIELVIKEFGLDRSRVSEVSKIAYASILRNVEKKFVLHGRQLHWSNMGRGFQPQLLCVTRDISDDTLWFKNLKNIVLNIKQTLNLSPLSTTANKPKGQVANP